ncbi:MAG: hypothetical protein AAF756_06955 [Pseudomonadota bacterium]
MRNTILISCLTLALTACGNDKDHADYAAYDDNSTTPGISEGGKLLLHPFYDSAGMVTVRMPFPSSWKVHRTHAQGAPTITGPNGLQVYDFPAQNFMYTNDPQMQQVYHQSGQQLRPMPDVDTLIQQDVVPWARQQGLSLVNTFPIPEVARVDEWYHQQLYQAVPTQMQHAVIGSDWQNAEGERFFLLMHLGAGIANGLQTWFYYSTGLQAEREYFDTAKKQLVFGLARAQYNPAQIQAYNQREAQKAGQSWAAHNQRMRSNQANFEATQRAIVGANEAVNNSIMQGWRDRNAMQDRVQEQFTDALRDQSTMVNPSTGEAWKVDAGANNYWINSGGEYLPSNDYNYNPNLDSNLNQQNWEQLEEYRP